MTVRPGVVRLASPGDVRRLVSDHEVVVLHLDAGWDGYRAMMERKLMAYAASDPDGVSFAYADIDEYPDFARSLGLVNVPALAYYVAGDLAEVVMGLAQDVEANVARLRATARAAER